MYDKMVYYYINIDYGRLILGYVISFVIVYMLLHLLSNGKYFDFKRSTNIVMRIKVTVFIVLVALLVCLVSTVTERMSENRLSIFDQIDSSMISKNHAGYIPDETALTDMTGTEYFTYEEAQEYWYEHYH